MKNIKSKNISIGYLLSVGIVGIALGIILQSARAWSEPTAAPPNVNIGAPLTTGALAQNKTGSIGTSGSISAVGAISGSKICIGNDCKDSWATADYIPSGLYGYCWGEKIANQSKVNASADAPAYTVHSTRGTGAYKQEIDSCACPSGFELKQLNMNSSNPPFIQVYACYKTITNQQPAPVDNGNYEE